MYILISIFYISFLAITCMILLKKHEFKTGKPSLISRMGKGSDAVISKSYHGTIRLMAYLNKKTFILAVQLVAYHILLRVRRMYVEIKDRALHNPHSRKVIDAVRGRGEINRHGASFYLRRIRSEE